MPLNPGGGVGIQWHTIDALLPVYGLPVAVYGASMAVPRGVHWPDGGLPSVTL